MRSISRITDASINTVSKLLGHDIVAKTDAMAAAPQPRGAYRKRGDANSH